ncbi:MAG TPA: di-heme oxidoredictase family protein [Candidatus Acidoferrum sp.]|nr:di-heme oxidoredictase family protein [Candidatus Acidoferrum sp.]
MKRNKESVLGQLALAFLICIAAGVAGILQAQSAAQDPGPRGGPAGAGGYYSTLDANEQFYFSQAQARFQEVDSVSGKLGGEPGTGLEPTFNGNSCAMCHAQPAVGGASPGLTSRQNPIPNPQVGLATLDGALNVVPPFITANGPVREARFIAVSTQSGAVLDGGVHDLYTIAGRMDAPGCTLAQPNFSQQIAAHNVVYRIPTELFGLGLVENTPDATLQASLAANASQKTALGIQGVLNTSGNDGTVTKFGWKAQNKSLMVFSGEAYNVEQGVTNEMFTNERSAATGCVFNGTPEDNTNIVDADNSTTGTASEMSSDVVNFAAFIRMSAPPKPAPSTTSAQTGQALFTTVGCAMCHTPTLKSGLSPYTGMSNATYSPYSDFALHHMGSNLADGIVQGNAGPDMFRTAPLWGVGQRLFFLHDGRTSDLLQAIQAHFSAGNVCTSSRSALQFQANGTSFAPSSQTQSCGSEANTVINRFNSLTPAQKQEILNFLRSL